MIAVQTAPASPGPQFYAGPRESLDRQKAAPLFQAPDRAGPCPQAAGPAPFALSARLGRLALAQRQHHQGWR